MIRERRRNRTDNDPLLTRPRVAELIERDPARVTRYFAADQMPEPDETLEGGSPAWRRSTIRTWWLQRGGRFPAVTTHRYHGQWTDHGLESALLEEQVVDVSMGPQRVGRVHVRAYRGMDGAGPVVLLGRLNQHPWPRNDEWDEALAQISAALVVDVDLAQPVWLEVGTESGTWRYAEHPSEGRVPSEVTISDIRDRRVPITPEDVARLIGRAFDVYPESMYLERAVVERRLSGDQDGLTPTPILDDTEGLGPRVRRFHAVVDQLDGNNRQGPIPFAAGVLASDLVSADDNVRTNVEFRRRHWIDDQDEKASAVLRLAVVSHPRQLSPQERRLADKYTLDPPLVATEERVDISEVESVGEMYRITLRPDARTALDDLRRELLAPDLAAPLRDALEAAERLLADKAHRADRDFARQDRLPLAHTWGADSVVMSAYLSHLRPVSVADLPLELKRRGMALDGYEYTLDWTDRTLLLDERHQLLALTGSKPSHLDEWTARSLARSHQFPNDRPMTPAITQALVDAYLADRSCVRLEWPQAAETDGRTLLAGSRIVAPAATDAERPVFIHHADGRLQPLSLNGDTHFHGFVWGVSGTDTITPALHALMTSASRWERTPEDAPGREAYMWLCHFILESGSGPLDVPADAIIERYSNLPAAA